MNGVMKSTPPVHEHLVYLSSDVLIQGKARFNTSCLVGEEDCKVSTVYYEGIKRNQTKGTRGVHEQVECFS